MEETPQGQAKTDQGAVRWLNTAHVGKETFRPTDQHGSPLSRRGINKHSM